VASKITLEQIRLEQNKAHFGGALHSMSSVDAGEAGDWANQLFSKDLPSLITCDACILEANSAVKGGAVALVGSTAKVYAQCTCFGYCDMCLSLYC
jgi:hypothetical protein